MEGAQASGAPCGLGLSLPTNFLSSPIVSPPPPRKAAAPFCTIEEVDPEELEDMAFEMGGDPHEEEGVEDVESKEEEDYDKRCHGLGHSDEGTPTESGIPPLADGCFEWETTQEWGSPSPTRVPQGACASSSSISVWGICAILSPASWHPLAAIPFDSKQPSSH